MNSIASLLQKSLWRNLSSSNRTGWPLTIREPFSGAWQQNMEQTSEDILGYHAVFACITLIANDISKLPLRIIKEDDNGIWNKVDIPAYSPVLRKPNRYQTLIQFLETWVLSLLTHGNTYVLKERDNRNVVVALYILDNEKVTPLVSDQGDIFYELQPENLVGQLEPVRVAASEIIHDRIHPIYHPLIGVSPIYAAALPILQGREIQKSSSLFFRNQGRPGGILTAPGSVSDETVAQLRAYWESNYTGNNAGKVAVLADGLTYKSFDAINAQTSQVIEQLKWTAEVVCSVFHVPPYKIGVGNIPTGGNLESENIRYYSEALHKPIEGMEALLTEGLSMPLGTKVDIDENNLWRMDSKTLMETQELGVKAGIVAPNEARKLVNKPPVAGGDTPYLQQQNFSLEALSKRDSREDPFQTPKSESNDTKSDNTEENVDEELERFIVQLEQKAAERFIYAR